MRIAVLGDIHGNLPALDAVVKDIDDQSVDDVWCTGDLGWMGPWASECIGRVRDAGWTTVKGNCDVWIAGDPQTIEDPDERSVFEQMAEQHAVGSDDARWLLNLPLGYQGAGSILMVHGTPASPFVAPLPNAPPSEFAAYEGQASLVIYGHVHIAFVGRLSDGTLVSNPGSVGLPMDGDSASYLIVDREGPNLTLRHRRVAFNREEVGSAARSMGGPAGGRFLELMGRVQ